MLLKNRGFEPAGSVILLGGLGTAAARLAVERERKLTVAEQELKTARRIRSSIIPVSSPDLPGLLIATRFQPMRPVVGDFFDFTQTGENSLQL